MKKIFWNDTELRLRAGWRILIQIIMVSVPLSIVAALGLYSSGELTDTKVMSTALPVTLVSVLLLGRHLDKRQYLDYGVHPKQSKWWAEYGIGFLAGFLIACLFVFILVIIGTAEIKLSGIFSENTGLLLGTSLLSIVTYAGIGIFEELLRVYQIRNITEGLAETKLGVMGAMFVAVFLAGLNSVIMHAASGDILFLIFILISSAIYGVYYLFTKRAAIAMGYHFSWDLTISFIFLLGASSSQDSAIFLVPIKQISGIDPSILLPLVGILVRFIGLIGIVFWIRSREGKIKFQRGISVPSLIKEQNQNVSELD